LCDDLAAGVVDVQALRALLEPLADIESASTRIGRIVSDLRAFSGGAGANSSVHSNTWRGAMDSNSHLAQQADVAGVDVSRCLQWALRTTAHEFRQRARVTTNFAPVPPVLAEETKLGQVFINLLVNAAHAIAPGHADTNHVRISTGVSDSGDIVITISDTGCGIADDARARIFEPFFTTKAPGRGTGLGLSISHGIMRSLGGRLEVESVVNEGTTMRVVLPAATPTAAPTTSPPAPAAQVARARVLAIDDEPLVLRLVGRVLRAHEVVCVDNANQAVALLERGEHFDVVLCDLNMPTMTGVDFYEVVLARFPEVARQIAFLSGGSLTPRIDDFLKAVPNLRLQKPFDIAALEALVGALLTGRGVGQ
jgi:CheY-like chemotaxis protein